MLSRLFGFVTAAAIFGLAWNTFGEASEQGLPRATRDAGRRRSLDSLRLGRLLQSPRRRVRPRQAQADGRAPDQANLEDPQRRQRQVNNAIEPISNLDHWGTTLDHWDYPVDGKGDCKIYALFKRKLLIERGFPRQALLMTIVRDLNGEGHAVLTVKTDRGDFVLDNLSDDVRPWSATGYHVLQAPGPGRPERLAQSRRRDRGRAGSGRGELTGGNGSRQIGSRKEPSAARRGQLLPRSPPTADLPTAAIRSSASIASAGSGHERAAAMTSAM